MKYSFCESVVAAPMAPWHIRPLTSAAKIDAILAKIEANSESFTVAKKGEPVQ